MDDGKWSSKRAEDLALDRVAQQAAALVRRAGPERNACERFLSRFVDHLHTVDEKWRVSKPAR